MNVKTRVMTGLGLPAILTVRNHGNAAGVLAVSLFSLPAERPDGDASPGDQAAVLDKRLRDHEDLVRALAGSGPNTTFAIRFIARPGRANGSIGSVDAWLLARVAGLSTADVKEEARRVGRQLTGLLATIFPDHGFRPAITKEDLAHAWRPLGNDHPRCVSFFGRDTRRVRFAAPLARAGLVGLSRDEAGLSGTGLAIAGIEPRPSTLARILQALLARTNDSVFQVAFRSVQLPALAEEFLVSAIGGLQEVERAAERRDGVGSADGMRVRSEELRLLARSLDDRLLRLRREAFQLDVVMASAEALEPELLRFVASELTGGADRPSRGSREAAWSAALVETPVTGGPGEVMQRVDLDLGPEPDGIGADWEAYLVHLADAKEVVAAGFRFPVSFSSTENTLPVRVSRVRPLPRQLANLSQSSVLEPPVGTNRHLGQARRVVLPESDRRQHLYCVGQTGVGKSTFLRSMILGDIAAGRGVAVLDPHGDLFEDLLVRIPKHRWDDVVLLDPTDTAFPVGLNPLECGDDDSRHHIVREMRAIMARLLEDQYPGSASSFAGPMFFLHLEMNLLLTMSRRDDPGTLLEFYEIFQRREYWKKWLPLGIDDAILRRWVEVNLDDFDYQSRGSDNLSMGDYVSSKFEDFVFDPRLRLLFGQKHSTIRIREILDEGKILLVNLSRGKLSEASSRFLGMLLMALFQSAASSRGSRPYETRKQFYLYVDEFQSISTDSFAVLLSEARKFGLGLVLANQFVSQIKNEKIMQAVFGNVATLVSFRVGEADATRYLEPLFRPYFDSRDLTNLPNWNACVRTTSDGKVVPPFSIETIPDQAVLVPGAAAEVKRRSRERYGRPRSEVEAEIERSLSPATD